MILLIALFVVLGVVAVAPFIRNRPMRFSIAKDFSRHPAGARIADGPNSGEALREQLLDLLHDHRVVEVNLDGTRGFGSSFLRAAFRGLGRDRIKPVSRTDPSLVLEINEYLA